MLQEHSDHFPTNGTILISETSTTSNNALKQTKKLIEYALQSEILVISDREIELEKNYVLMSVVKKNRVLCISQTSTM
jgi:acetamidase/formamidase